MTEPYVGVTQAKTFTGLSESTIYHYAGEKKIPCYKVGSRLLFKISELEAWIEAQAVKPKAGDR